jgi:hypothetical protein
LVEQVGEVDELLGVVLGEDRPQLRVQLDRVLGLLSEEVHLRKKRKLRKNKT